MAFTLKSFAVAIEDLAALEEKLPAREIGPLAKAGQKILVDASARSGGIKAGERSFVLRKPTKRNGYASVKLVGRGFAVLDEYGSYKSPAGYYQEAAGGYVLAGPPTANWSGFASSVFHPPQEANPYLAEATAQIGVLAEAAYDRAVGAAIKKVGL